MSKTAQENEYYCLGVGIMSESALEYLKENAKTKNFMHGAGTFGNRYPKKLKSTFAYLTHCGDNGVFDNGGFTGLYVCLNFSFRY